MIALSAWSIETTWIRPSVEVPALGAAGRTQWGGMIPELRTPPKITLDNDPYYWVSYAREMAATGAFRIRHTDLDNTPYGREVHWNSGFSWWLILCGHVTAWFTGESLRDAIYTGSVWANPAFLLLFLGGFGAWIGKRFGVGVAAGFLLLFPALPALMWDFGYGRADHHSMHNAAAFGLLAGLVLAGCGWTSRSGAFPFPTPKAARFAVLVSAVSGGIGLWVGATQQIFLLTGAGLGLFGSLLIAGFVRSSDPVFDPRLLRLWGRTGCVVALVVYAIEYLPSHASMRLEVNHPLYAFAWLAAAEILAGLAMLLRERRMPSARESLVLALASFVVVLPAAALLLGPPDWHAWRDPFMRRQHDFINEFEPFSHALGANPVLVLFGRFGLLPLLPVAALVLLALPRLSAARKALLLPPFFAVILTTAMMFQQVRWAGLVSVSLVVLALATAAVLLPELARMRPLWHRTALAGLAALLVLPNLVAFGIAFGENRARATTGLLDPYLAWIIASRDVAFNLKRIAARESVRVMCGPGQAPALHFFGGVPGTGALYWENIDGVRETAEFFSDQGEESARRIARARGITHVVIEQSPSMAEQSTAIFFGPARTEDQITSSLAWRLASPLGKIPDWLEPAPYYGSPMAANFKMRIYRVRKERIQ